MTLILLLAWSVRILLHEVVNSFVSLSLHKMVDTSNAEKLEALEGTGSCNALIPTDWLRHLDALSLINVHAGKTVQLEPRWCQTWRP